MDAGEISPSPPAGPVGPVGPPEPPPVAPLAVFTPCVIRLAHNTQGSDHVLPPSSLISTLISGTRIGPVGPGAMVTGAPHSRSRPQWRQSLDQGC